MSPRRYELDHMEARRRPRSRSCGPLDIALACLLLAAFFAATAWLTDPAADLPAQPYERTMP